MAKPAKIFRTRTSQYLYSILAVLVVAAIGYSISDWVGYRVAALMLLMTVSLLAMFVGIGPVLTASALSALIWDFFFIPPRYTFHVDTAEDTLLLLMYLVISLVTGVLTFRIRQNEIQQRDKEEKEKAIKLYNTLLNSLSHELRTPIATIVAATDYLQSGPAAENKQQREDLLNEISTATTRLNQQVENLLNMSRLESGLLQVKKDWCDIQELVHNTMNNLADITANHTITIAINNNLPLFKVDYGLLEQVLRNLVINAVNYTPENTEIFVGAGCEYNSLLLVIADKGRGFPEAELQHVFNKFYRLDNTTTGGTGLGLSIVKGFVEAHGGQVTLENVQGGGARFTIEIPAETNYMNSLKNE